ncbi:MAG: hypothetical protein ABIQ95_04020 [Bdellovibrionia bacterium]
MRKSYTESELKSDPSYRARLNSAATLGGIGVGLASVPLFTLSIAVTKMLAKYHYDLKAKQIDQVRSKIFTELNAAGNRGLNLSFTS